MEPYFDLGTHNLPITTNSPETQLWFDRGLNWCYGFNHEEAEKCFRTAISLDEDCAMAYWGLAYAAGPNYNLPWFAFAKTELTEMIVLCHDTIKTAQTKFAGKTALEIALINALANRFQSDHIVEDDEVFKSWNDDYANAMRSVCEQFPEHSDVCALTADACIGRTPWLLWDLKTGEPGEDTDTLEVRALLEKAMARAEANGESPHPGILHLYIHLMEMSPFPEVALPVANALRDLVPDAGHLRHMPSHIDILCGHYEDAMVANHKAHIVNEKYAEYGGVFNFYTLYRCHDVHFTMYAAMFLGQSKKALEAADIMAAMIPPKLLKGGKAHLINVLEGFVAMRVHACIRFGKWQKILDIPMPEEQELYCVTTALLHYAKGVAHAALGEIEAAEAAHVLFESAYLVVPEERLVFNNQARDILDVGREMLCGELEYRKKNYPAAFAHLRQSVELHDNLKYTEPWVWMQPARHALGALLLEQGHVEEAEAVYRADLGLDGTLNRSSQHPGNVWSMHGYYECLQKLGKDKEADKIKPTLDKALARADIEIRSSCFCRQEQGCCEG